MKRIGSRGGLSGEARDRLIARTRDTLAQPLAQPAPVRTYDTAFETLPRYQEFNLMRAAADTLGIASPFFRPHEARAGASSVVAGRPVSNFSSYDYLGYNSHPAVLAAAHGGVEAFGCSVSASRIVAGQRLFHAAFERALADFYEADDAVTFVSGHATNVSAIATILGPADLIVHDSLIHNSIIVGAQLSGATRRFFPHNDLAALQTILASERHRHGRTLIAVEGNYSMDGDSPDLPALVALKQRFGAWLMVDEAHSLGVVGPTGRGLAEEAGVPFGAVDIWMGTLSKTLASCGGYVAGAQALIDYLKLAAPGFVYSVGLSAPATLAAHAALDLLRHDDEGRVARLQHNSMHFIASARDVGLDVGQAAGKAIVPVIVGNSLKTVMLSNRLLERGINVLPIIHPAVPEVAARLRFFLNATHDIAQIDGAVAAVREELDALGPPL